jgi:hypothetical protein
MSDMHSQGAKLTFKGLSPNCGNSIEIMILPELVPVPAFKVWTELNEMGIRFKNPVGYLRKHDHMVEA